MKAVWAIERLRTDTERERAVDFVADLGCNMLITNSATPEMVARANKRDIQIIATVFPYSDDNFENAPSALPSENARIRTQGIGHHRRTILAPVARRELPLAIVRLTENAPLFRASRIAGRTQEAG